MNGKPKAVSNAIGTEQTNDPTETQINRAIHEWLGKCWHERDVDLKGTGGFKVKLRCTKCGDSRYRSYCGGDQPDYCSGKSERDLLDEAVVKADADGYGQRLADRLDSIECGKTKVIWWPTPAQIARAMYECLSEEGE